MVWHCLMQGLHGELYEIVRKLGNDTNVVHFLGNLPNKYSRTFNVVIFSHPGKLKILIIYKLTSKKLKNWHTKIAFKLTFNISH